jgi:hypothetical protein
MIFNTNEEFSNFVYENICQCFNQCIDLNKNTFLKNQLVCSEITTDNNTSNSNYYDIIINNAINFFINQNVIFKNGKRYYLSENNTKLTWDNIKSLNDTKIKKLLWLFRKLVIDCLLKKFNNSYLLKIFSVGSTNLSSDYDITLYGNDNSKIELINNFNKIFYSIFSDNSSLVFDTNIYGKAYIAFSENDFKNNGIFLEYDSQKFFYLKRGNDNSQICWALTKYINDTIESFGEHIFNDLVDFMKNKLNSNLLNYAIEIRRSLKNKDESFNYDKILGYQNKIVNYYDDKLTGQNDYISLVNFYGIETYFTRGSFLDIVVNEQMCKNDVIDLNESDLLSSILENVGFFFNNNNKTKYFIRVNNTIKKLINKNESYNIDEIKLLDDTLNNLRTIDSNGKINYDNNYCKWIGKDDFNLLNCEKYSIFNILFKIVYKLLKIYITNNQILDRDFLFYNIFINENNNEQDISPINNSITLSAKTRNRSLSSAINDPEMII